MGEVEGGKEMGVGGSGGWGDSQALLKEALDKVKLLEEERNKALDNVKELSNWGSRVIGDSQPTIRQEV